MKSQADRDAPGRSFFLRVASDPLPITTGKRPPSSIAARSPRTCSYCSPALPELQATGTALRGRSGVPGGPDPGCFRNRIGILTGRPLAYPVGARRAVFSFQRGTGPHGRRPWGVLGVNRAAPVRLLVLLPQLPQPLKRKHVQAPNVLISAHPVAHVSLGHVELSCKPGMR